MRQNLSIYYVIFLVGELFRSLLPLKAVKWETVWKETAFIPEKVSVDFQEYVLIILQVQYYFSIFGIQQREVLGKESQNSLMYVLLWSHSSMIAYFLFLDRLL